MTKKLFFASLAFFMAITLSGCGGPPSGGPGPEPGKETASKSKGLSAMEDVCKYFPKEIIEEVIGRPIVRAADDSMVSDAICSYYTEYSEDFSHTPSGDKSGGPHIVVVLNDENEAEERAEYEQKGYKFEKDESFSWEHYLVTSRGSKTPYRVDLIIDDNNYFMIKSNHFGVTDEEIVKIGKRLSERMKNGK